MELKSPNEMKNPLKGFSSRFKETEEKKPSKCEDRSIGTIQSVEQKEKRMKNKNRT